MKARLIELVSGCQSVTTPCFDRYGFRHVCIYNDVDVYVDVQVQLQCMRLLNAT